jgi:hypothetical protein
VTLSISADLAAQAPEFLRRGSLSSDACLSIPGVSGLAPTLSRIRSTIPARPSLSTVA